MTFASLAYVIFFLVVLVIYWPLRHRGQNLLLLAGSYFFYGWAHPAYLALIITISVSDFTLARLIASRPPKRKVFLTLSLVIDFGILAAFKYFGFFVESVTGVLEAIEFNVHPATIEILLPVGISFYVFQSSSYVIDVYRGKMEPTRSLLHYAAYVSFFPQLVAGPIERAARLLVQIESPRVFSAEKLRSGFLLMMWGFYKKVVIADNTAVICNRIFSVETVHYPVLWAGVLAFGVQIYADFSAYTDIARGSARMLGIDLVQNFNHPYLSRSPGEFWGRWHISLSTWFRDYVYIPLGGSRCGPLREYRNIFITFFLSGLWHGAAWNFVLWGCFHGVLLIAERVLQRAGLLAEKPRGIFGNGLRWLATFVLVHVGWLLFREGNFSLIVKYLTLSPFGVDPLHWQMGIYFALVVAVYALPIWLQPVCERWYADSRAGRAIDTASFWPRLGLESAAAIALLIGIIALGSDAGAEFIYFQF